MRNRADEASVPPPFRPSNSPAGLQFEFAEIEASTPHSPSPESSVACTVVPFLDPPRSEHAMRLSAASESGTSPRTAHPPSRRTGARRKTPSSFVPPRSVQGAGSTPPRPPRTPLLRIGFPSLSHHSPSLSHHSPSLSHHSPPTPSQRPLSTHYAPHTPSPIPSLRHHPPRLPRSTGRRTTRPHRLSPRRTPSIRDTPSSAPRSPPPEQTASRSAPP